MIFKALAFLAVIFIVYLVFFKKSRESEIKKSMKKDEEIMDACPTCKTFVSKEDAILSNGKYFCSKECLQ
ncbi:MAG: hypothetical protein HRT41_13840 [Campylobacteraceae bacterium]|nr:hypothetical protein [Campylobacteraceae bacterium]